MSETAPTPAVTEMPAPPAETPAVPATAADAATKTDVPKLTGAELKKQKQAEKTARRQQATQAKQAGSTSAATSTPIQQKPDGQKGGNPRKGAAEIKNLPTRNVAPKNSVAPTPKVPKEEDKTVEFFRHLYKPRSTTTSAAKDVHPTVLALGLQMKNYSICGSCARLVATMQAFKKVIESYTTPAGNTLSRHFTPHVLSPQIDYLTSCRPLSISMGNAIRWLKLEISDVDIDTPDVDSKKDLCIAIDTYIKEKVIAADQLITEAAAARIRDGDVIMTYAKSSVVQSALVKAYNDGKKFRVIVVDSRPLMEGRHLAESLSKLDIEVKYCLINGLAHNIQDATKVFLGAHAMMSNGRLLSRVGTALVAMEAKDADIPVIVLCETVKFTERVALDSIIFNEIAPADELVISGGSLEKWKDVKGLQLLNPMYDVTPADYIQIVITEHGSVPPTSVPVLHRLVNESQSQ